LQSIKPLIYNMEDLDDYNLTLDSGVMSFEIVAGMNIGDDGDGGVLSGSRTYLSFL